MNPREVSARFLLQSRCLLGLSVLLFLVGTPPPMGRIGKAIATGAAAIFLGAAWGQRRQYERYAPLGGVYAQHELAAYGQFLQTTAELGTAAVSGMWDTVNAQLAPADPPLLEDGPTPQSQWWALFRNYPSVLIWGPQGSGKTTQANRLVIERLQGGHQVIVCDPHWSKGDWEYPGVAIVGAGMDYDAVDGAISEFAQTVKERYEARSQGTTSFPPVTIVCEEFTHWASRCKAAAVFLGVALSDIRKVGMAVIFVSHGRSLECVGGKKGMAQTRDDALLELKLLATPDPSAPNGVRPAFLGELKRPAVKLKDAESVAIDQWSPPLLALPAVQDEAIAPVPEPTDNPFISGLNSLLDLDEPVIIDRDKDEVLLIAIQEFGADKNEVAARDLKQLKRPFKGVPTKAINALLEKLVSRGVGTLNGANGALKWHPPSTGANNANTQ
ncbi:MAG: hypothetical protein ACFCBU_10200 [Cyanophyceae cyanobacterium]